MKKYRIIFRNGWWFAYRPDGVILWNYNTEDAVGKLFRMTLDFHQSMLGYGLTFVDGKLVSTLKQD